MDKVTGDMWTNAASYESYMGRWSHPVAREFIPWLAVLAGKTWLDVGCGTGGLTETIFEIGSPRYVVGTDASEALVDYLRHHLTDQRLCFDINDAHALNFDDEFYDNSISGLFLNFVTEPRKGIAEMIRVTKPGGTIAAYVWDYAGEMQMLRYFWDAAAALDPTARELDEGARFILCKPEPLSALFRDAGLQDIATRAIDAPMVFRDWNDFWLPFLEGVGYAPSYVKTLNEERRAALRERIQAALPIAPDGTIHLTARAWAVRGTR